MTTIDRRAMLRVVLGGATAATAGLTLMPNAVDSAPLTLSGIKLYDDLMTRCHGRESPGWAGPYLRL